ncbi:MAG TPA: cytochrome c oxidase subunit II [Chloroflexota bacterium]|nr:cytochrome c oxidase subunit II [Chloroflexota bacterium]
MLLAAPLAVAFFASPSPAAAQPWVVAPASDGAETISQLFWFTLVLATIVFVLIEGLLIYSSLRFRRRAPLPFHEPPQMHGNTRLEVMWATVPALILVGLFGITVSRMGDLSQLPTDPSTLHIGVTGRQFQWDFAYGTSGVKSTNDLHIPVGTPLIFDVTSIDVIHSFWVPDLYGKIDANPGRINHITFKATQPGTYRGVCAELCGPGHAGMQFRVEAVSLTDFQQWLEQQQPGASAALAAPPVGAPAPGAVAKPGAPAAAPGGNAGAGAALMAQKGCGGCHTVPGVPGATGSVGPNLAGVASRTRIAGGVVANNGPDDLKKWIMNPSALKPGTAMPTLGLSDDEATTIVAFLETLK